MNQGVKARQSRISRRSDVLKGKFDVVFSRGHALARHEHVLVDAIDRLVRVIARPKDAIRQRLRVMIEHLAHLFVTDLVQSA